MKTSILSIVFIIVICSAYSQNFYGGVKAGVNLSQVDGDDFGGYNKIAPFGGVYVRNTFNNKWGGLMGIKYKHKGSKDVKRRDGMVYHYYEIRLDYIEIPVLATYKLERFGIPSLFDYEFENDFFLEFGASYSYLIQGTEDFGSGPITPEESVSYRDFKSYDISTQAGMFYRLNENWLINLRWSYTFFLFPVRDHPGDSSVTHWSHWIKFFNRGEYNRNINLSVMYEF